MKQTLRAKLLVAQVHVKSHKPERKGVMGKKQNKKSQMIKQKRAEKKNRSVKRNSVRRKNAILERNNKIETRRGELIEAYKELLMRQFEEDLK